MRFWTTIGLILVLSAVGLTYEIAAGRVLAPFFGTSLVTWTAVIATVLAGFSLGNALGGLVAERERRAAVSNVRTALVATAVLMALSPTRPRPAPRMGRAGNRGNAAQRLPGLLSRIGARQRTLAVPGQARRRGPAGSGGIIAGARSGGGVNGRDHGRDSRRFPRPPARRLGGDLRRMRGRGPSLRAVRAGKQPGAGGAARRWPAAGQEPEPGVAIGPPRPRRLRGEHGRRSGMPVRVRPFVHPYSARGWRSSSLFRRVPGRRPSGSPGATEIPRSPTSSRCPTRSGSGRAWNTTWVRRRRCCSSAGVATRCPPSCSTSRPAAQAVAVEIDPLVTRVVRLHMP